jgi:hypothetical protein
MTLRRLAIHGLLITLVVASVLAAAAQHRYGQYEQLVNERKELIRRLKDKSAMIIREDDAAPARPTPHEGVVAVMSRDGRLSEKRYYSDGVLRVREWFDEGGRLFRLDVVERGLDRVHVIYDAVTARELRSCFFDESGRLIECLTGGSLLPVTIIAPRVYPP